MSATGASGRARIEEDLDYAAPSPGAAVVGLILFVVAVYLAATRVVGAVPPLEVDIFRTAEGWRVAPDPAAARVTTPGDRKDGLDCAFLAPAGARGEGLVIELTRPGAGDPLTLPGAPVEAGWNTVPLDGASRILSARLTNALYRWPRPEVVLVRGGPPRPAGGPSDGAVLGAVLAGLAGGLGVGTLAGPRALLHLGVVLLLLASGVATFNEHSGARLFLSGEAAIAAAAAPVLVATILGRVARRRFERRVQGVHALPSMGGSRL